MVVEQGKPEQPIPAAGAAQSGSRETLSTRPPIQLQLWKTEGAARSSIARHSAFSVAGGGHFMTFDPERHQHRLSRCVSMPNTAPARARPLPTRLL